jgi:HK97 family phage major capsid protein
MQQCAGDLSRKDLSLAANASGGFAWPKQLADSIDRVASIANPWLADDVLGAVETSTGDYRVILGLSDVSSSRVSEVATRSATSTPAFRERTPVWGEYYAFATVSEHAREDIPNLEEFLVREFAAQLGASLAADIVAGTGSNGQILGFSSTTPVVTVDSASPQRNASALQYVPILGSTSPQRLLLSDIENLLAAFREEYLLDPSFAFMMRPAVLRSLYAAGRTGVSGVVDAAFLMPRNPTLYGFPVKLTTAMPAIAANAFPIVAGAWKRAYALCARSPMMVTIDASITAPGLVKYRVRRRYGATPRANDAAKLVKFATS